MPPYRYDPAFVAAQYDQLAEGEWQRLISSPIDEVNLHIHAHYLRQQIPANASVLEIGAGAGRFTQILAELGARVWVADLSPVQLDLNRHYAAELGFEAAVVERRLADITDLSAYPDAGFDRVVAYGGPFSYVLERRGEALAECARVQRPGGILLGSVMSLWGSCHRHLLRVLDIPPLVNQRITASGELTPDSDPQRTRNYIHIFRAGEIFPWLQSGGFQPLALAASGVLANGHGDELAAARQDPARWAELLRMELDASADPACAGMGTHLIFAAQKSL